MSGDQDIRRLVDNTGKHSLLSASQPVWAYLGAIGTFAIVFVFNSVVLWNGKMFGVKFMASFLSPILGLILFLGLKIKRTRFFTNDTRYWGVNLSQYSRFEVAIQRLNGKMHPATVTASRSRKSLLELFFPKSSDNGVAPASPSSTGSEIHVSSYRPGNFVPMDNDVERMRGDGTIVTSSQFSNAPSSIPGSPHRIPRVQVEDVGHEMDHYPAPVSYVNYEQTRRLTSI